MPTVDGVAALETFKTYSNMTPGRCLQYVWNAMKAHGATSSVSYPTAMAAYNATGDRHFDKNPPRGALIWYGPNANSGAGDVAFSEGNGMVTGVWGTGWRTESIDSRGRAINRPYLAWTGRFMTDNVISFGGTPAVVGSNQRQVGVNPANGRSDPSTNNPAVPPQLAPGTVGNFNGWIHGQNVNGNDVWFRGTSGRWFWSGGFTDAGTHDLTDLNVAPKPTVGPAQREVGPNGSNGRGDPSTAGAITQSLPAGSIWDFNGWIHGQDVSGNNVWFRGTNSGNFFWSGGFTDTGTHDLADLNTTVVPPQPTGPVTRTAGANPVNVRAYPYTTSPATTSVPAGTVVNVANFAHGESVSGNNVWFLRADTHDWVWSGGFTDTSAAGLAEIPAPQPPTNPNVLDPAAPWKSQPVDCPFAVWVGSPNYNYRASVMPKTHITLHWMTSTLAATDAQFQNPGTVIVNGRGTGSSANYGVNETVVHQYVKEDCYVQSDGNADSNATTISIEHEGGWLLPDGTRQTPTKGVLDMGARVMADIAKRHGWTKLEWMVNVFPHDHFVDTQCPGTLDYAYEIDQANKILAGTVEPPVVVPPVDSTTLSPEAAAFYQGLYEWVKAEFGVK